MGALAYPSGRQGPYTPLCKVHMVPTRILACVTPLCRHLGRGL